MTIDKRLTNKQDDPRMNSRSQQNRVFTENRQTADAGYVAHLAVQQGQLPTPPERPGFHRMYLSTTNQYDSIHSRLRMGYMPVKLSDLPQEFAQFTMSGRAATGFEGCFSVNEMILCEIEDEKYQAIRRYLEHQLPLEQEQSLKHAQDQFVSSRGQRLGRIEESSTEILDNEAPPPVYD